MNKWILSALCVVLIGCQGAQQTKELDLPAATKIGFLQLGDSLYYVDTKSFWKDNQNPNIFHFDTVENFRQAQFVVPSDRTLFASSIRQGKTLNCETYKLIQTSSTYYADFWGEGSSYPDNSTHRPIITLEPTSTLYTLGQVVCANLNRSW